MILSPQEKIRDCTAKGWWGTDTLDAMFRRNVAAVPEREAVVDAPNRASITDGAPRRLTYRELNDEVEALAARLLAEGVGKNDIVAMQVPNIVEAAMALLATARIGAIVSPIGVQYRENELSHIFGVLKPKAFVTMCRIGTYNPAKTVDAMRGQAVPGTILAWGSDCPAGAVRLDDLMTDSDAAGEAAGRVCAHAGLNPIDANDIVTICWTSGTESRPKGVPRSHNHWIAIARMVAAMAEMEDGERMLNPFPVINMASIGGCLVPWLLRRGTMVMHHPFDLKVFLGQVADERINYNLAPPAILNMLIKQPELWTDLDFSNLRAVCSGSAPLAPWMMKAWQEDYGVNVINYFGSNEGCGLVSSAVDVPDPDQRARYFARFGAKGFSWSCDDVLALETRLVDPVSGQAITEPDREGELRIRGGTVFDGYFGDDELNRNAFDEEGYFRTGDMFAIASDERGPRFYRFVGRLKEIIIRGGQNISPAEIESLIDGHPKIAEAAVVGLPDEMMGERVCAVIVPRNGAEVSLEDIVSYLKERHVAIYKWPERIATVEALPRNQVGKVVRADLREMILRSGVEDSA
ncbi:MAG: acyl--CoA ligase [Parvibaculum sp.]|nr:acyl--CoA ligase [Parvibaculum sp.]